MTMTQEQINLSYDVENEMLRTALFKIMAACRDGKICDDVVWYNESTTLWEFCAETLVWNKDPNEPLPTDPKTPADIEYMAQRIDLSINEQSETPCAECGFQSDRFIGCPRCRGTGVEETSVFVQNETGDE